MQSHCEHAGLFLHAALREGVVPDVVFRDGGAEETPTDALRRLDVAVVRCVHDNDALFRHPAQDRPARREHLRDLLQGDDGVEGQTRRLGLHRHNHPNNVLFDVVLAVAGAVEAALQNGVQPRAGRLRPSDAVLGNNAIRVVPLHRSIHTMAGNVQQREVGGVCFQFLEDAQEVRARRAETLFAGPVGVALDGEAKCLQRQRNVHGGPDVVRSLSDARVVVLVHAEDVGLAGRALSQCFFEVAVFAKIRIGAHVLLDAETIFLEVGAGLHVLVLLLHELLSHGLLSEGALTFASNPPLYRDLPLVRDLGGVVAKDCLVVVIDPQLRLRCDEVRQLREPFLGAVHRLCDFTCVLLFRHYMFYIFEMQ
eukprot:PhM_4_TR13710/c0_g1_i1/m.91092